MKVLVIFASFACLVYVVSGHAMSWHNRYDGGEEMGGGGGGMGGGGGGMGGGMMDFYHFPMYKYDYGVKDMKTGDHKKAWEMRHGDHVKGGYMLDEPDGTKRVVEYVADGKSGFNAIVKQIGKAEHPMIYGVGGGMMGGGGGMGGGMMGGGGGGMDW